VSDNQQPVVDTADAQAKPVADATDSARKDVDDLDSLLAEFDQGTKKPDTVSSPDTKPTLPDALAQDVQALKSQAQEWAQEKNKRAIAETVDDIRGDVPKEVFDDEMVEAWLDAQARRDPRLAQAWLQREQNSQKWGKVKAELGRQLAKKAGSLPDRNATDDREAVAAAVRGASAKAAVEPAPNFGAMTDAELRKYNREHFGFE
jgi:hypothetical protein